MEKTTTDDHQLTDRKPVKRWAGKARYAKRASLLKSKGLWQPWADVAPVRAHLETLRLSGMTRKDIAKQSGVARTTLDYLAGEGRSRCRTRLAQRLLAVQPVSIIPSDGRTIASIGTQRRLQALMVAGWSAQVIADRLGVERNTIRKVLANDMVRASTAYAVRVLFAELWDKFPPFEARYDRASATRTRAYAARQGWVSGLAWDDIDDPKARPKGVRAPVEPVRDPRSKTCPRCKEPKSFSDFARNRTRSDGMSSYCLVCMKEYRDARRVNFRRTGSAARTSGR